MTFSSELAALNGAALWQHFTALCQDAASVQEQLLLELIQRNAASRFGREHGFAAIQSLADFRRQVPMRDWNGVEPWVTALVDGEADALTVGQPVLRFIRTTGTTGVPKLVPMNEASGQANAVTMNLRLFSVLRDHPEVLQGDILALANPPVSGHTASGVPYGPASGLAMTCPPQELQQRFAYPPAVLEISEPANRIYALLRFALQRHLTLAVANNPHSFTQLFDAIPVHAESFVADIRTGRLSTPTPLPDDLQQRLAAELRPNPERAVALEAAGALSARVAWPNLRLIVCWKTGLMSRFLPELAERCPSGTIFREYGYGASEGLFTIPLRDDASAGVLAIHGLFFEFLPEEASPAPDAPTLLAHELEIGQRYQLVLTNAAGLYRYCLGDLIEVNDFLGQTPQVTFLRKVGDVLNLLGEKLDARQVEQAMEAARRDCGGIAIRHYQWLADEAALTYQLCVEAGAGAEYDESCWRALLEHFERQLGALNPLYQRYRSQDLLKPPRLRLMRPGWLEALLHGGGYQAKPKIVGYQLAQAEYAGRLIEWVE